MGLQRLLDHIESLDTPPGSDVRVVIVDNDADGSGRDVVEAHAAVSRFDVVYLVEPTRGIWAGRNRAVAEALGRGADAVAFIDDDEWPEPTWLAELVRAREATGADVVTGPILPVFDETPPGWAVDGRFFERPGFDDLADIPYARTSQVLISKECFDGWPDPFDRRFGLSGGDDTHFFAELRERGHRMVWAERAVVYESVPASRIDVGWILRRQYRRGQTLSLSLRLRDPRPVRYVRRLANGMLQIAAGVARAAVGLVRGHVARLHGVEQVLFGAGMVTGLFGRRYDEYVTSHGS